MTADPPITTQEAIRRATSMVNNTTGVYMLGTGDYRPRKLIDLPWTKTASGVIGSDCAGFAICWAWKLRRHRPGFNKGPWATVEDDINVNSTIEDAYHKQEIAVPVEPARVKPGDLLCYPTIYSRGHKFIGHVGMVVDVP